MLFFDFLSPFVRIDRVWCCPQATLRGASFAFGDGIGWRFVEMPVVPGETSAHHLEVDVRLAKKDYSEYASVSVGLLIFDAHCSVGDYRF